MFLKRLTMKAHKYEVEIEPKKLELSIAVAPVKASVLFKRGKTKVETKFKPNIENKEAYFKDKITISSKFYYDKKKKKYQEKMGELQILVVFAGGTRVAGFIKLNLADYANNNKKVATEVSPLDKCPDKTAKLHFTVKCHMMGEHGDDHDDDENDNSFINDHSTRNDTNTTEDAKHDTSKILSNSILHNSKIDYEEEASTKKRGEDVSTAKEMLFGRRDQSGSPSPDKYASDVSYDQLSTSMIGRKPSPQFGNIGDRSLSPIPKKETKFEEKEPIAVFGGGRDSGKNNKNAADGQLQKKMENMEVSLKSVSKEKDDILLKLKNLEREKEELATQNQKLRSNNENNNTLINKMQTEIDYGAKGNDMQITKLKEKNRELEREVERIRNDYNAFLTAKNSGPAAEGALRKLLMDKEKELLELRRKLKEQEQINKDQSEKINELSSESSNLRREVEKKEREYKENLKKFEESSGKSNVFGSEFRGKGFSDQKSFYENFGRNDDEEDDQGGLKKENEQLKSEIFLTKAECKEKLETEKNNYELRLKELYLTLENNERKLKALEEENSGYKKEIESLKTTIRKKSNETEGRDSLINEIKSLEEKIKKNDETYKKKLEEKNNEILGLKKEIEATLSKTEISKAGKERNLAEISVENESLKKKLRENQNSFNSKTLEKETTFSKEVEFYKEKLETTELEVKEAKQTIQNLKMNLENVALELENTKEISKRHHDRLGLLEEENEVLHGKLNKSNKKLGEMLNTVLEMGESDLIDAIEEKIFEIDRS